MFVKICGLMDRASIDAAVEAGADAVGFVFAESVREIEPRRAHELCRSIPEATIRVAVMRHPSAERFAEVIEEFAPNWIQTDAADFAGLPANLPAQPLPVYRDGETQDLVSLPERLLFEGRVSGSGSTADWHEARRLAEQTELILAGGLNAANIGAAISQVRPYGVDVSSGVESSRGKKDIDKIREFVARVRALELEND